VRGAGPGMKKDASLKAGATGATAKTGGDKPACRQAGSAPTTAREKDGGPKASATNAGLRGSARGAKKDASPRAGATRATAKTGGDGRKSRTAPLKAKGAAPDTTPIGRLALPGDGRRQACLPAGRLRPYQGKRKRWRPPTSVGTGSGWRYMVLGRRRQSGDWRSQGDAVVALRTSMKSAQPGVGVLRKAASESERRTAPPVAARRMGDAPLSPYRPGVTIGGNAPENCDLDANQHRFPRMEHFSKSLPVSLTPLINLTVLIRNTSRA
jgi:hypothetical protein